MKKLLLAIPIIALSVSLPIATAQVNSGSNGSDGALHPISQQLSVDMSDHPDGIYQYTSVWIPSDSSIIFKPNAKKTPVVWLVQGDCVISGIVYLNGESPTGQSAGAGGVGGYSGGVSGSSPSSGQGPGGGAAGGQYAGNASYGTAGTSALGVIPPGPIYGNQFIVPLLGGSGGGGSKFFPGTGGSGGGGGGGAVLIVANGKIEVDGYIGAIGGNGYYIYNGGIAGGSGSGGAVRLVANHIVGTGQIDTSGGSSGSQNQSAAGSGRIRFDSYDLSFAGTTLGSFTQGFQPIILPTAGQGVQLNIQSVAGNSVPTNPSGVLANPDIIVPAQTNNPVPVVVSCTNVPLNSEVTVTVHPANGSDVQAVGLNNVGNSSSSTATVSLNLPRGGGIIYASVVTGISGGGTASANSKESMQSYAKTGLTANGERFAKVETKAFLGGKHETTLITTSGKRYRLAN